MRRWLPSWSLSLALLVFWLLLNNSVSPGNIVLGAALAIGIPLLSRRMDHEHCPTGSLRGVPKLAALFAWDIVKSNLTVAAQVLGRESKIEPGFVWIPLDITNLRGITVLASMITLTPGTLSAVLTDDRRHLLVHALHIDDAAALVREIKTRYETPLMEVFP
ncbi:multisubunit potassium/proton antiporter, PhaE subunit [Pseudoxanthomonas sp. GM95]|uniref:Na+/H+ antiporter subunit E n=1 Tax=Pseudoxanthomonas sp. GM95 TaxID=1881043 RepID=UPI0008D06A5B|nr:Na+/H+ antiporter subunit E [Pseudoxanthomonas sp. GM95]SEK40518.1 multisubunit potassium/proton antiporter, PhaE subunit [Pseudoxanthomonas sp. GM95]